ncbi:WD40 repeat-like protein [Mycena floridula]|nr:WD40 repeat-like protein [Mycena floridula]
MAFLPSFPRAESVRRRHLSNCLSRNEWHRIQVLGEDLSRGEGHNGCVNSLSWAQDGRILISSGDDTTVNIWRPDAETGEWFSASRFSTGHTRNIFNAQLLPNSSRVVTVAGDRQVRVLDASEALASGSRQAPVQQILSCHEDRVSKRIVTEDSPDLFLTVSEDGTCRQHDLRTSHRCRGDCPDPLLQMSTQLSTIALSPLTPYQFVVAGKSNYGFLFDRRYIARARDSVTTCVRRFGRKKHSNGFGRDWITGARMSSNHGDELILSYSGDGIYRYSTLDDPGRHNPQAVLTPNLKSPKPARSNVSFDKTGDPTSRADEDDDMEEDPDEDTNDDKEEEEEEDQAEEEDDGDEHTDVEVVYPRIRYVGIRNVETIKDCNFLGPFDEYITSGSDDGNFFVWNKADASLAGIYEGDSSVVNVVEQNPNLPLVAVSGIDKTVKIFSPQPGPSPFSKMDNAEAIMRTNGQLRSARTIRRIDITALLATVAAVRRGDTQEEITECTHQ